MTVAADPGSDRIAIGVLTVGSGATHTWLSVWSGAAWGTPVAATSSQNINLNYPNVAVAFESLSGDALAVYAQDTSTNSVQYRTWSLGAGWLGPFTGPPLGANPNSQMLYPDPASDRVMLASQDSKNDLHYVLWDGTSWSPDDELETNTGETKNQPFIFFWSLP